MQPDVIDKLTNVLYNQENMQRAYEYCKSRFLDMNNFPVAWACSSSDITPFKSAGIPLPHIYTESVFIPIMDITDPDGQRISGYDIRYIGNNPKRVRYQKMFRETGTVPIYNFHRATKGDHLIICEGAADCESIRSTGHEAMGVLSARKSKTFIQFLYALPVDRVFLMFDNDQAGRQATEAIMDAAKLYLPATRKFIPVSYAGKDANESIKTLGLENLKRTLDSQIY